MYVMARKTSARGSHEVDSTLFVHATGGASSRNGGGDRVPLAERMRPRVLDEYVGQEHVVGPKTVLRELIEKDRLPSLIFWGPPGVGKTTLARVIAGATKSHFVAMSAVLGTVAELRQVIEEAKERLSYKGERTIVFVDEIHRFHKGQQDAFLPHVEAGTIRLIGATTENPSFAVNGALLSRTRVFRLEALSESALVRVLERALAEPERGLGALPGGPLTVEPEVLRSIARAANGDARRAMNLLELLASEVQERGRHAIERSDLERLGDISPLLYDKSGEEHYNVTSAFIKSMRGTDPDAAIYYAMRMLDAGEDPLFLLRRLIIFASEDIGNADARALLVATEADAAFRRIGMPEGMYPIAHAVLYLASAPKSNAVKNAWHRAKAAIAEHGALPVPMKLRNAPTQYMKSEGYGSGYRYPHDEAGGAVQGETYLPDALASALGTQPFYEPTERGEETRIKQRLDMLRSRGNAS